MTCRVEAATAFRQGERLGAEGVKACAVAAREGC